MKPIEFFRQAGRNLEAAVHLLKTVAAGVNGTISVLHSVLARVDEQSVPFNGRLERLENVMTELLREMRREPAGTIHGLEKLAQLTDQQGREIVAGGGQSIA